MGDSRFSEAHRASVLVHTRLLTPPAQAASVVVKGRRTSVTWALSWSYSWGPEQTASPASGRYLPAEVGASRHLGLDPFSAGAHASVCELALSIVVLADRISMLIG